jgi:hypothetical protein
MSTDAGRSDPSTRDGAAVEFRRLWPVATFTAVYLLAATLARISLGNLEFLYYIVVVLVFVYVVWSVHRYVGLTRAVIWALSVWGLAHMAGGLVPLPESWPIDSGSRVLYSLWLIPGSLKYDQVVHAYGFGVTTWVCWQGISAVIRRRGGGEVSPTVGLMVLAAAAGMGFGALNELIEFVATLLLPETNVGGYLNTGWDLVANFFGATAAVAIIYVRGPHLKSRMNA